MKVCIFTGTHNPTTGGAYTFESQVFEALAALAHESRHQFFLFRYGSQLQELKSSLQADANSNVLSNKQSSSFTSRVVQMLRTSIGQLKPVKTWYHKYRLNTLKEAGIEVTLALSSTYLTTEIPYIPVIWDIDHKRYPFFPEVSADSWENREQFYTKMIAQAAVVITGTEFGKSQIGRLYGIPPERITVIPMPTPQYVLNPPDDDERETLQKYQIPENYLFYPAQFWTHKNHVGLLLAVQLLRDKYNLKLPVVFSGSDQGNQPHVKQVVEQLGLSKQVYFAGFITQSEMVTLYRNAFALVYLSFFGPDNLPPLEAMALGCPVIASRLPGSEEQLENVALLCAPTSTEQIAETIKTLWDDDVLRQTLIQRGKERSLKWTTKDYAKSIFATLDAFETMRRCWN
jgi:glycosyltransferase involved in cell wall biosynthesis